MLPRPRALPAGFIAPCLPTNAPQPPSGDQWLHEIKHDGFRVIACKIGKRVKLYSRPGNDLTYRFPLIVEAVAKLRSQSCIIDGEAVSCGDDWIASFDRIRYRRHDADVFMWAFDLIELNGEDLRRARWKCARQRSPACSHARHRACGSMSTWKRRTARSYSSTPASSG
jgi:ATP-dependent DNA ligase